MTGLHVYPRESAMHGAVEFSTRWGYVTLFPPMRAFGRWWPWGAILFSRDATPGNARWLVGPRFRGRHRVD